MVTAGSRFLSFAALAALLYGIPVDAQTGRISGVVRSAGGVAASGAMVRATNQSTGATSRATTAADGSYTVSNLAPGAYTVSASLLGQRAASQKDVRVAAGAAVLLDLVLQPLTLEAVTVTAMLREQEVKEVPFSVVAATADVLRARGADNIEAIAANVAGLAVQNLGPGQSQPAIRGASSGQIARDQPGVKEEVGAYLDEVPISLSLFTPDLDLFDVSRVEVLRGPQGTLFGSGSLGGTVRYISNQPELGESSTFGEVGGSAIDRGAPGSSAKLGFNVPMGDKVAFRVAGYSNRLPGYMDAVQPNLRINQDVNGGERTGVRAAFRIVPSQRFSVTPRIVYQDVKMDGWNRIDAFNILANPFTTTRPAVTLGERQLFTQSEEPFTDQFLLTDLNLKYDAGPVSLTSITSYTHRDILVVRDATALTGSITGGTIGLPANIYTLDAPLDDSTNSKVWTQELRLSGGRDRVKWLVGGFYSKNKRHYAQDLFVSGFDTLAAPILGAPYGFTQGLLAPKDHLFWSTLSYDLRQYAAFGEATLSVTERLALTGGLRYYDFDESRQQIFDGIFAQDSTGKALLSQPGSTKANGVAPRFIASYKVSDALTLNAQASRGFRLGGINDPLNLPLCTRQDSITYSGHPSWKDETAWNYEVGAKSEVAGGRASINLSAFYMDIRDLQLTVTAGQCSSRLILNAPKARSTGIEAEVTASPNEHLDFSTSLSLDNSKLRSSLKDVAGNVISAIQDGNRLPTVPQVQWSAAVTYRWSVGAGSRVFIGASDQYVGSRYTLIDDEAPGYGTVDLTTFGAHTIGGPLTQSTFTFDPLLPAYNLFNLRVGVTRERWELTVFGNNLTDERAFLALDRERGRRARVGYLTNQPRTVGATLRFSY
ncbi:MAG: TonB-dependent receptor [Gemmatimonadetes bacterium]|nr:MAG: TonB-dependent receptor [Gemmatimonadota bacterium]PYP02062.1 MAG: TonB-dependent receptor [Gemmatimonadota bacterium]